MDRNDEDEDFFDREDYRCGDSFADAHPILATAVIVGFIVVAGVPALAMFNEGFACKIGASEPFCGEAK